MLACITEVESRAWRDGMIEGLTRGYALAADDGLRGNGILRTVMQRFNQLTPPAYHSYITAYLHQDCIKYGIIPKMLSFWQWRTLASDLAEIAQVAELLGCTTGFRAEEVRCALLLHAIPGAEAEPDAAPYQSLLDHGGPADPEPHYLDGLVDAYNLCWQVVHDWGHDGVEYCDAVREYLEAFWPEDYMLYRQRCNRDRRPSPAIPRAPIFAPSVPRLGAGLEYGPWSALVDELAAEIERCTAAGASLSRKRIDLSCRLLCRVDEPAPSLDWTLPPKLEEELSW
jgi:hypothetical protein